MPTLFRFFGIRFYFYSLEHLPIHIHVSKAGGEAKFVVAPEVFLESSRGMSPKDLLLAEEVIREHQAEIITKWNEYFKNIQP